MLGREKKNGLEPLVGTDAFDGSLNMHVWLFSMDVGSLSMGINALKQIFCNPLAMQCIPLML